MKSAVWLLFFCFVVSSCSPLFSNTPAQATISVNMESLPPAAIMTPIVINLEPGHHYATPDLLTEKPLPEWKGIPVMPSATVGSDGGKGYYFYAESTLEEVNNYYLAEMARFRWDLDSIANIMAGSSLDVVELTFKKKTERVTVSIMPQSENLMYLILTWHY